jgi:hypothetical protein
VTDNVNDVEKRWHDPETFRAATRYVLTVVAIAMLALAVYVWIGDRNIIAASTVPTILLVGGIGAFIKTYQVWKARGTWVMWQGAGWFLMAFMLVCLAVPGSAG